MLKLFYQMNFRVKLIKEDILKDINYWARRAYSARMTPATSGNISRFEEDIIFMSRSGVCLGDMGNEDVSELNINGGFIERHKTFK